MSEASRPRSQVASITEIVRICVSPYRVRLPYNSDARQVHRSWSHESALREPMMSALDQAEKNRRNAARSTGPRTVQGKLVSKMNALRAGMTSSALLLPGESEADLRDLDQGLRKALQPVGTAEEILVDRIVIAEVRRRRAESAERSLLFAELAERGVQRVRHQAAQLELEQRFVESVLGDDAATEEERSLPRFRECVVQQRQLELLRDSRQSDLGVVYVNAAESLDRIARHRAAAERSSERALHELERLQARRDGQIVAPAVAVDVTVEGAVTEV